MSQKFDIELSLENTLSLYFQGPEVWNKFVEDNGSVYFNFKNVAWGTQQLHLDLLNNKLGIQENSVSFKGYKFKAGVVDFTGTDFGSRPVDFSELELNNTSLMLADAKCYGTSFNLSGLKIGIGELNLKGISLGSVARRTDLNASAILIQKGNFICSDSVFHSGEINFTGLTVNADTVDFSGAVFGDGDFSLLKSKISCDDFWFISCVFGSGKKYFSASTFNAQNVNFSGTNFGFGDVEFDGADFSTSKFGVRFRGVKTEGNYLSFANAKFPKGVVAFSDSTFNSKVINCTRLNFANGEFLFEGCEFHGRVSFSDGKGNHSTARRLSFRKSVFHSTLDISDINTESIIDLRETKLSTHTTLDNLGFKLARRKVFKFVPGVLEATSKDDASKLRRLKEIAETNKNHTAALRFHAAEMRARRWHDMPAFSSILDAAFSMLSNYGQSIFRPFIAWLFVVFGYSAIYSGMFNKLSSELLFANMYAQSDFGSGFLYSLIQTLPVFPISRALQQDLYLKLSNQLTSEWLSVLTISQNLLGVIFLFLIGLGLRNRFRL